MYNKHQYGVPYSYKNRGRRNRSKRMLRIWSLRELGFDAFAPMTFDE